MLLEDPRSLQKKSIQHSLETMGGIFNPRAMRLVENATLSDTYSKSDPLMTELTVPVIEGGNIPRKAYAHFSLCAKHRPLSDGKKVPERVPFQMFI